MIVGRCLVISTMFVAATAARALDVEDLRRALLERGVSVGAKYTGEVLGTVSGGLRRRAQWQDLIQLQAKVDFEPLVGWKGASVLLHGIGVHGGNPSRDTGVFQLISGIEAPNGWKLFEAYLQHTWLDGRVNAIAGLYDVDGEFDVAQVAGLFVHASHGTGGEFGASGRNGPSVYPTTSTALRLKAIPTPETYVMVAVADGVPGNLRSTTGTHIIWHRDDGVFVIGEAGWGRGGVMMTESFVEVSVGAWYFSSNFDHLRGGRAAPNLGAYALAEGDLFDEGDDAMQGLAGWVRVGGDTPEINLAAWYVGGGLVYTGLLPGRDTDQLGVGVAMAVASSDARTSADAETAFEFMYVANVARWLQVQPEVQWIIDPGFSRAVSDAVVVGLRVTMPWQ